jgi:sugar phosphate isomerase/epimerase
MTQSLSRRGFLGRTLIAGTAAVVGPSLTTKLAAASQAQAGWQIGCYTRPWDKLDYREALDAIAAAGYQYAGLMTTASAKNKLVLSVTTTPDEAHAVAGELKKRGLKVPSVYGGGIGVEKSLEAGIEGLRKLIDSCVIVGASSLLMGGIGNGKLYDAYYKAIAECCDYAAEKKLLITVKPHGGMNSTGPQCRKCIEQVGHKNFRLWYDPGNIFFYSNGELDPIQDAATVDGLVAGMCIKDYKHPKAVSVTPGTGQVQWLPLMKRLRQGGFTSGPLVVECLNPGEPKALLEEAKKARQFVEELVAKLG